MRLERLSIGGFGPLPVGRELPFAAGLNLVLAPNERGKTTLGELIAGLFYGFGNRVGGVHPHEPWSGGTTGGELVYRLADGNTFTLARHLDKREQMGLRDSAGRAVALGGRQPGELHLGLGQGAFLTVSRICLDDLQQALYAAGGETKELKATRQWLAGYFFSEAATRGQATNPVGVLQAWREQRERLYSTDRRKGAESKRLLQAEQEAQQARAQAQQREAQAREAAERLEELAGQGAKLEQGRAEAAEQAAQALKQVELAKVRARRDALRAQAAELERQGIAPAEAEAKARELVSQARAAGQRAGEAEQAASQAQARAQELVPGQAPQALEERLRDLTARRAELIAAHRHQESEERRLASRAAALREQWGLEPSALAGLDPQLPHKAERLRAKAEDTAQATEQARQALGALPSPPAAPAWWLALGIMGIIGGAALLAGSLLSHLPVWSLALGGALILGGAGLGVLWALRRGKKNQALQRLEAAQAAMEQAQEQERKARAELDTTLEALPPDLRAAQAIPLSTALAEAVRLEQDRAAQAEERAALEQQRGDLLAEARDLAPKADGGMETALDQARARAEQAKQAQAEAQRQGESAARESEAAARLDRELAGHLAGLGLADMQALAMARQREAQVRELQAKAAEIEQGLGESSQDEAQGETAAQTALDQARGRVANLDQRLRELATERGALAQELEHLTRTESVAQAEARLERLASERRSLAREHDTLLVAETLLARAMEEFRLEAQPGLLQKAGEYLKLATDGAYEWLGTDLFAAQGKGDPEISARTGPGAPERDSGVLSRGARDQLYLCLRLALADEITADGEPLPLILDDPLVNFDDQRLAATLRMLCAVADRRQVLLLTCHQRQADMLAEMCEVNRLEI